MTEPIEIQYLDWLVSQIEIDAEKYTGLFEYLHEKEFVWIIPNDDNRVADAMDLRKEFYASKGKGHKTPYKGTSVLEVIVALSRRMGFAVGDRPRWWAWIFIEHLGLHRMTDPFSRNKRGETDGILEALIWRTYERNGTGGFFPMPHIEEDQTKIEIWYQMNSYIMENNLV